MHREPSQNTLLDSFKELASSMPIPDEFEYELELQDRKSDDDGFTCGMDDSGVFAEHPLPQVETNGLPQVESSRFQDLQAERHSPLLLRGSSVLRQAEQTYANSKPSGHRRKDS